MLSCLDTVLQHVVVEKNQHGKLQDDFGVSMSKKINSDREKPIITWGSGTNI